jgi:hypothetical protein
MRLNASANYRMCALLALGSPRSSQQAPLAKDTLHRPKLTDTLSVLIPHRQQGPNAGVLSVSRRKAHGTWHLRTWSVEGELVELDAMLFGKLCRFLEGATFDYHCQPVIDGCAYSYVRVRGGREQMLGVV